MNPFDLLKADHRKVELLFEKLEATTERAVKKRADLFAKLKEELTVHAYIEEKVVYPVAKEVRQTRSLGFEAVEEHRIVKTLLSEIDALPADSEEWTAKVAVLMENVKHHVKEEEKELFPALRKALTRDEQATLAEQLAEEKEELLESMSA